jgi:hypothetical protein
MGDQFRNFGSTINQNPGRLTRLLAATAQHDPNKQQAMLKNAEYIEYENAVKQGGQALVDQGKARTLEEGIGMVRNPTLFKQTGGLGGSGTSFGKTPIWGTDASGKTGFGVIVEKPDGSPGFQLLDTGGFQPRRRTIEYSTGTEQITQDADTGEIISTRPIENREKAAETKIGEAEGEGAAVAPAVISAGEDALYNIDNIRNDPYLESAVGWKSLGNILIGTPGYDFQARVDEASSGAFLTAIERMRGMGALSDSEGKTARQAVTRMKTSLTKDGFIKAIDDYERIVNRGIAKAQRLGLKFGTVEAGEVTTAPTGVDQEDWDAMTPAERAAFIRPPSP